MEEVDLIRQVFLTESVEHLQNIEDCLLAMETNPDDTDTINALFRAAHTIKGSSGIVGLEIVEKFTHNVESLLDKVRRGELRINADITEVLLKCRDHIASLIEIETDGRLLEGELKATGEALKSELLKLLGAKQEEDKKIEASAVVEAAPSYNASETSNWHLSLRFSQNVLQDGMDPISFINYLSRIGEIVYLATLTDTMPSLEEMNPENCYLGFELEFKTDFDKKTIDDVFEFVREDSQIRILPPHSSVSSYVELIRSLPEDPLRLGELLVKGGALTQSELDAALQEQDESKGRLGEILVKDSVVHPEVVEAAVEKQKRAREVKSLESQTIRVDINKLDQLVNMVGELVITGANINQQAQRLQDGSLLESASAMSRLVEAIRERSMQVRMVPINEVFTRFNRVVRDICHDSGKEIELVINGGDTEVDKTVVEKISDPLMHLVRNAADHGLEMPEARAAKGKRAKGVLKLNAFHDAGCIVIEVVDDGAGLNKEKIIKKALERGMLNQSQIQTMTDGEIYRLIFEAGLSTAEQITKLSGRGVGMDVVRKNIEALRGTVEVSSQENQGTTVSIRLPLTLAIIDGFLVGIGDSSFVIPLDMVVECVELSEAYRESKDRRSYINLRGEVLPYLRLKDLFEESSEVSKYENIVVVKYLGFKVGLVVDNLFGEVQAVIKSLGRLYKDIEGVSGATILGDGTVALILDIPRLVSIAEKMEHLVTDSQ
ncbi:MAG: chemotaxis protein CheA [Nitrospirae bacterium]|nr:chemotaxis protein CheA [Nitrospirota bacterium]